MEAKLNALPADAPERGDPLSSSAAITVDFQLIDIDTVVSAAGQTVHGGPALHVCDQAAVTRLYGRTASGQSICARVHGFLPYFYAEAPPGMPLGPCARTRHELNTGLRLLVLNSTRPSDKRYRDGGGRARPGAGVAARWLVADAVGVDKTDIMGFNPDPVRLVKIVVGDPAHVAPLREALEQGSVELRGQRRRAKTYDSRLAHEVRFMIDLGIVGSSWLSFDVDAARPNKGLRATTADLEVDLPHTALVVRDVRQRAWSHLGPVRTLSFDIECKGRENKFPEPEHDPVIQIAVVVVSVPSKGQRAPPPPRKTVLTLGTCSAIAGCTVAPFDNEADLLCAFAELVAREDPDHLTGYNIENFDFPYILRRAEVLGVSRQVSKLSRDRGHATTARAVTKQSNQAGARKTYEISLPGRVVCDMLRYIRGSPNFKLESYSLNAVASKFLGDQKMDVHYSAIAGLQDGDADTRRTLAQYCLKDAELPLALMDKLCSLFNEVEMARVTGVPLKYLTTRGQGIKVLSMIARAAHEAGYVIPSVAKGAAGSDAQDYEGATVLTPKCGFYDEPIATLDFASLYPSIMIANNLCYTTFLPQGSPHRDRGEVAPSGHAFVPHAVREGLLPSILRGLIRARANARAEGKNETDPIQKAVLDGRQLALKVAANSVYGFTGASTGGLYLRAIAESVTAFGRQMIDLTKRTVEQHYTVANGYKANAEVIYGDTDSVMVRFFVKTIPEAMRLGLEAAAMISALFKEPIRLEFEKVFFPYLLQNKKRYAGLFYGLPKGYPEVQPVEGKYDKVDCKGLEVVRRDNCPMVRRLLKACLDALLVKRDVKAAQDEVKRVVSALRQGKVPITDLVITKLIAKTDYTSKMPHTELAERMMKRDPGAAFGPGTRIAYVFCTGEGSKAHQKAEDPVYAMQHRIPIDNAYYESNQLRKPVTRLFESICRVESLFEGDHSRSVVKQSAGKKVGIMAFVKPVATCTNCHVTLQRGESVLCAHCRPLMAEIVAARASEANRALAEFNRCWTACQRCAGTLFNKVECASRECPNFYRRESARHEVAAATAEYAKLDGFKAWSW